MQPVYTKIARPRPSRLHRRGAPAAPDPPAGALV